MTLQDFATLLTTTGLTDEVEKIAKDEKIVIAIANGGRTYLSGALNIEFDTEDEDGKASILYFDTIGSLSSYLYYEMEGYYSEDWEKYLKRMNKQFYKMDGDCVDCNFPYLDFELKNSDDDLEIRGIVFHRPKFDGIYLNKYRNSSYQHRQTFDESQVETFYWTCDACGGNQDTGCLSTVGKCFR